MKFCKYQGAGNDFILIDNRSHKINLKKEEIAFLCNRRFGIGADGLMLVEKTNDADFAMRFFNSDGSAATMCGNGSRCIVAFAHRLGIFEKKTTFYSGAGKHFAEVLAQNANELEVKVRITDVAGIVSGDGYYFLNTGVPHCVVFVDNIDDVNVAEDGAKWRYDSRFENGANVNFVQIMNSGNLRIATYERGVEGETLACGTGATAAAIAAFSKMNDGVTTYKIAARGGLLGVSFDVADAAKKMFTNIWLQGPATFVFEGEIWEN